MYFSKENVDSLQKIIVDLNCLETEMEQKLYLDKYVEDVSLFLQALKSVNKKKLPKTKSSTQKVKRQAVVSPVYQEDDVYRIFKENDEKKLLGSYSLVELKGMYYAIYKEYPLSKSSKEDILKTLKNRFSTMTRAAAFSHLSSDLTQK